MEVGANTYSLRALDRAMAFARLRRTGFSAIELWAGHAPYASGAVDPARVTDEAAAAGLDIRAYCIGGLFGLPLPEVETRIARAFEFARGLGTDLVTGILDRAAVVPADRLCRRHGMRLGIENHWYTELARPEDFAVLADCSPALGVCLDTGHLTFLGGDLLAAAVALGSRIVHVHLKAVRPASALGRWWRRQRRQYRMEPAPLVPGDPLGLFVVTLGAMGYGGVVAIEHEGDGIAEEPLRRYRTLAEELLPRELRGPRLRRVRAHG